MVVKLFQYRPQLSKLTCFEIIACKHSCCERCNLFCYSCKMITTFDLCNDFQYYLMLQILNKVGRSCSHAAILIQPILLRNALKYLLKKLNKFFCSNTSPWLADATQHYKTFVAFLMPKTTLTDHILA